MKKIICYGDSNTFGYNTKDNSRFDENIRWTSVLQKNIGAVYEVINEGACDRTGFVTNPKGVLFSAQQHFPKLMSETERFDLLILWVGTNDLQTQYDISTGTVEKGLEKLISIAKEKAKNIIIIPPVILSENVLAGNFSYQFNETSIVKSKTIGSIFKTLAGVHDCEYFDINEIVTPTDIDGLHYDEESHKIIGNNMTDFIISL